MITVQNHITIDVHDTEFGAFKEAIHELTDELRRSNEIAGEAREKLLAEIRAGIEILKSPKPDRT